MQIIITIHFLFRLYEPRETDYDKVIFPKVTFKARDLMAEMQVMYEFLTRGIDREDVEYLRRAYEALLAEDAHGYWLNDTHWVDHPPTDVCYSPPKKKSKRHNNIYEDLQVRCIHLLLKESFSTDLVSPAYSVCGRWEEINGPSTILNLRLPV